ncbi:ABC transporter substrate-binding protein [Nonomuraea guangzhouensis]|uniref:ABC transporter substrate-binding protein n=1 Tax=Nonomuraea guangzhouensis TaxID=1291555 RepID=A0ABW4GMF4_9ACTN|nr:ABC transporter substrate-binding protein [Nonomuraea guangzhouensis]
MTTPSSSRLRLGACLSLSGKFARFGKQAGLGLDIWQSMTEGVELTVEDDGSDPDQLEVLLPRLAESCDILLGPYSTLLMRRAGALAEAMDHLIWNHGGSGDDVETAHPGHVVSVLTPTSRYAEPFIRHLAAQRDPHPLWILQGKGSFGRQVADGAERMAHSLNIRTTRLKPTGIHDFPAPEAWSLFCAGSFEEDAETVTSARSLPTPPRTVCAVAAGVREFGEAVDDPLGVYGVGQWFPGAGGRVELFIAEDDFLAAYRERAGSLPDYPAVQAIAAAAIATHCARQAGSTAREALWSAATTLETTTMFGTFKVDHRTGAQIGHQTALTRWGAEGPAIVTTRPRHPKVPP